MQRLKGCLHVKRRKRQIALDLTRSPVPIGDQSKCTQTGIHVGFFCKVHVFDVFTC
jgi:hypothetical protein